jgi:hypothetical protein
MEIDLDDVMGEQLVQLVQSIRSSIEIDSNAEISNLLGASLEKQRKVKKRKSEGDLVKEEKRKKTTFTDLQTKTLRMSASTNPYPSETEKIRLNELTGLEMWQIESCMF